MEHVVVVPYSPRPWQRTLHEDAHRFKVVVAHRGSGKSYFALNELIRLAITGPPAANYLYIMPHQNQARRTVWDETKRFCRPIPNMNIQNQTMEVRFPNGAKLHILGSDNPDALRGLHVHAVVLDEVDDMQPDIWMVVRPTLSTHKGRCTWIGTPKGRGALWEFYQRSQEPNRISWSGMILPWYKTDVFDEDEIEAMRSEMSPEAFAQEMECSFESALIGAYFGRQLAELREKGHIAYFDPPLYRDDLSVMTSWDLGQRDAMAVWYWQQLGDQIRLIDYDEYSNLGFPEWVPLLERKGYRYSFHVAPFDIKNPEMGTGITRLEAAARLGLYFQETPYNTVMDGVEIVRQNIMRCKFDLNQCSKGVDTLGAYKAKLDKAGHPIGVEHDWASHCGDSFRYGMAYIVQVLNQPSLMRVPLRHR